MAYNDNSINRDVILNYSNSSPINLFNNINKTLAPFYG